MSRAAVTSGGAGGRCRRAGAARGRALALLAGLTTLVTTLAGCAAGPRMLKNVERRLVDRALVEYPAGCDFERHLTGLTGPTAIAVDPQGNLFVAEGGIGACEPRIYAFTPDGERFDIYPLRTDFIPLGPRGFRIYGPVGGMTVHEGRIYVSHRDADGFGVITAFDYNGGHRTVVAGLPAQGEHGVTQLAIEPRTGRLFFGVGSATNSGVVGPDDFAIGWVKDHPQVHDIPYVPTILRGRRFNARNPSAGLFTGPELAVSAPFQEFGVSNKTRIPGAPPQNPKCNSAIYSISLGGGDLKVEAHGIRYPRGLAFNEYGQLYFTNNGMELRGTRPVKDDADALLRWVPGTHYGFPDYSADLLPIDPDALRRVAPGSEERFQPPADMVARTGYPDVSFVIDHEASNFVAPNRGVLLQAAFASQSGAAGLDFVRADSPFKEFVGGAIVALNGDRAPFATSGLKLNDPRPGYKVVRVDLDRNLVRDFVHNVPERPRSQFGGSWDQLERPIDVKFGPDGSLYILDFGQMTMKDGKPHVEPRTGQVFRLKLSAAPTPLTRPAE